MKAVILKQVIIGVLFAVLIPMTTWWGFAVVYERPDYSAAYKIFEREYADKIEEIKSKDKKESYKKIDNLWNASQQKKMYTKQKKLYEHMSLYVFMMVAMMALVIGSVVSMPLIGSGFLLAGFLSMISSGVWFFNDLNLFRAIVFTCMLTLLIFFSYKNMHRK